MRTDRYKLIHFQELNQWELYDLRTDPEEIQNRYDDPMLSEVQAELKDSLVRMRAEYGDPDTPR